MSHATQSVRHVEGDQRVRARVPALVVVGYAAAVCLTVVAVRLA